MQQAIAKAVPRTINELVVHSAATRVSWMSGDGLAAQVAEIRRWHVEDNKWSDIGYHFIIGRSGEIMLGRPLRRSGAHVKGHNKTTIGICLIGGHGSAETDTFGEHYTKEQDAALRSLLGALGNIYPIAKISGHNEYAAKACPGFNVTKWLNAA